MRARVRACACVHASVHGRAASYRRHDGVGRPTAIRRGCEPKATLQKHCCVRLHAVACGCVRLRAVACVQLRAAARARAYTWARVCAVRAGEGCVPSACKRTHSGELVVAGMASTETSNCEILPFTAKNQRTQVTLNKGAFRFRSNPVIDNKTALSTMRGCRLDRTGEPVVRSLKIASSIHKVGIMMPAMWWG